MIYQYYDTVILSKYVKASNNIMLLVSGCNKFNVSISKKCKHFSATIRYQYTAVLQLLDSNRNLDLYFILGNIFESRLNHRFNVIQMPYWTVCAE